ncbi:MAG: glycosyltransferase [Lentimicrobium sp.]|nr:glycosyltransferase [Lentimicrobium sp.]
MKVELLFLLMSVPVFLAYLVLISRLSLGWFRLPLSGLYSGSAQVSVIIAARNEAVNIESCLNSLSHQDYPFSAFEIIVIDDHSEDETAQIVEAFGSRHPQMQLRLMASGDVFGKKAALRKGAELAKGSILLTTDADCICGPFWISQMAGMLSQDDKMLVSGPVMFKENRGAFGFFQQIEFASLIASGAGAIGSGKPMLCNGANMGYRKAARFNINEAELQPHLASGDDVFLLQAFATEYGPDKIGFLKSEAAMVLTSAAPDLTTFWQQRLRWSAKSTAFKSRGPVVAAIVVWLTSFMLIINILLAWISAGFLINFLILFAIKVIVDLPLLISYLRFSGQQKLIWGIIPAEIGVVFYTALLGLLSRFTPVRWKGRKITSV